MSRSVQHPLMTIAQKTALNGHEIDTLTWSARGMTSDQIAQTLGLSKRNVDFHLDSARAKLGAATRIQAVAKAVKEKLIEP